MMKTAWIALCLVAALVYQAEARIIDEEVRAIDDEDRKQLIDLGNGVIAGPVSFLPADVGSHIVNGREAEPHAHPYMGALYSGGGFRCGCSLISKRYALTAAHCVQGQSSMVVLLGAHDRSKSEETQARYTVESYVMHEGYRGIVDWFRHDIAVMKLAKDVTFTKAIQPLKLVANDQDQFVGRNATITGWGLNEKRRIPSKLNVANLTVITNEQCNKQLPHWGRRKMYVSPEHVCVFIPKVTPDSGDSGSPLVLPNAADTSANVFEIGLCSWGYQPRIGYPMVFSRVSKYLGWIKSKTGE